MRKPSSKMGTAPRFRDYTGTDAAGFVASENVARRHMSASQLAIAAGRLAEVEAERAKARMSEAGKVGADIRHHGVPPSGGTPSDVGTAASFAAKKLGTSERTAERGVSVVKKGTPEVVKAVESNVMSSARILPLAAQGLKVRDGWDTPPRW